MRAPARLLAAAAVLVAVPAADARLGVIYDTADNARLLVAPGPDGTPVGAAAGWLQQQPAAANVLPASRQAWKVSGAGGSASTPTVRGLDAAALEALLVQRIRRSGAHVVFLDELTTAFRGEGGRALADALARMDRPSPWGGTYARRVHVYVPTSPDLLASPAAWGHAWQALARSGGVWFQTYRGDFTHWTAEEWETWPREFARHLAAAGGDPARLRPVFTRGDVATAIARSLAGPACPLIANGVGVFRLGADVAAFRAAYGAVAGPRGTGAPVCAPAAAPSAPALDEVAAWTRSGTALPDGFAAPRHLPVGVPTLLRVDLPADPLGLAARLGIDPAALRAAGDLRVWAFAPGTTRSAPLDDRGDATLALAPAAPGPVRLELRVRASALAPAGWPDRLEAVAAPGAQRETAVRHPSTFRLWIPLGTAADPLAGPVTAVGALPPVRDVRLALTGPGRSVAGRRLVLGRVTRVDGAPGAYARVRVVIRRRAVRPGSRTPRPAIRRVVADVGGRFRVLIHGGSTVHVSAGGAASRLSVPRARAAGSSRPRT